MMRIDMGRRVLYLGPLAAWLFMAGPVSSQTMSPSKTPFSFPDVQTLKQSLPAQTKSLETFEAVPVDAPISATEYTLGPGDRLSLNVWSSSPSEGVITVSPEGLLLVPAVGVIDVNGMTLAQARARVGSLVVKKYVNAEVSLTLLMPRKVSVTILGQVPHEGRKSVYASQRVTDLIELGIEFPTGRMDAREYEDRLNKIRAGASERLISLQRRTGEILPIDLLRYRIRGDGRFNPYLREGDVVYIPRRTDADNVIGVYGATIAGANFEFVEGDSLSMLIAMGMGFPADAEPEHAVLTRLTPAGTAMDTLRVDARAIAAGRAPDIALRPGDRLIIPKAVQQAGNFWVEVDGEVLRAGRYPITRESTRLSQVIAMAGGLTKGASLSGAVIYRLRSEAEEKAVDERELLLSQRASLPAQDTSYYRVESMLRLTEEVLSVDFRALFVRGDSTHDVALRTQDRIVIPSQQRTVYVFGQVVSPGHVMFEAGREYESYIAQAGGFANEARVGDVKIIKCGTRVWLDPDETEIEDGDMVWVPKETSYPFSYYVTLYSQIAGIVAAAATVALLINTFK